jgi:hypothetical protein
LAITSRRESSADCQSWPAKHAGLTAARLAPATTNGAALPGQFHDTSVPLGSAWTRGGVADWQAAGAVAAGACRAYRGRSLRRR